MGKEAIQILIVDDDEVDRENYRRCLAKSTRFVTICYESTNSSEAFAILEQHNIDCLILDYNLPGDNGLLFLTRLRESALYADGAIIFITGGGDENIATQAMKLGADDYLTKVKVSPRKLNQVLDKVMEQKEAREEEKVKYNTIHFLARHDMLTGCLNRHSFNLELDKQVKIAKRYQRTIALLFIDLDHFKHVNDQYSHSVGDLLLKEVTHRILNCCRKTDVLGRMGGDEFALNLIEIDELDNAGNIAEKIINILKKRFIINEKAIYIGASIGICVLPNQANSAEELIQHADFAMYRAKSKGHNQYEYFSQELNQEYMERISLEQDLNFALDKKQFHLVYQPQYDLKNNALRAVEVLLRWEHPERGYIPSEVFMRIAEESGVIKEIDDWVLESALSQYQQWLAEDLVPPILSVNVSVNQFRYADFPNRLIALLNAMNIAGEYIEIELTETTLMKDINIASAFLDKLKALNIHIAIDDFGTGYSSLEKLRDLLPISTLKIDKSFIANVDEISNDALIAKSIIDIGRNLNLSVVAEGVETIAQVDFLKSNDCDYAQGYYYASPMSANKVRQLFK